MIECMVAAELMSYSEVQAMTFSTEVMEQTPINCTEKMEMMKYGPHSKETMKFGVVLVMT